MSDPEKNLLPQLRDDFAIEAQESASRAGQYNFRFLTDDPNLMGQHFNEFRQNTAWNHSNSHIRQRPVGGDTQIIDGPHDYAYNKLLSAHNNPAPVVSRSQNHFAPQAHQNTMPQQPLRKPMNTGTPQGNHGFGYQQMNQAKRSYAGPDHGYHQDAPRAPQQYQQHSWGQAAGSYSSFSRQSMSGYPDYMDHGNYSAQSAPLHHHGMYQQQYSGYPEYPQYQQQPPQGRFPVQAPRTQRLPSKYHPSFSPQQVPPQEEQYYEEEQQSEILEAQHAYGGSEYCAGAWDPDQDGDLTTSAGSDKKKLVAELKIKSMIEQRLSKVVHVKGLESEDITADMVSSLFANFGNIKQLLFLKKKHTALVEYLDQDSASFAREMLNNLTFFGSQLKVSYSTYMSIEENLQSSNNPDKFREVFTPNPKSYRFKDYKKISINPPSKVLHLSNISKESYNEKDISDIFSRFGQIRKVKLLNGSDAEKCMALIEFASLESALAAISTLHNKIFFSR